MKQKFSIGCDHGALELKNALVEAFKDKFEISDKGTFDKTSVDYPDFAKAVCADVAGGKADFGVLLCTTGIGMSMAANKARGIRAGLCHNADCAKFTRLHNNANVLCMGAKYVPLELAKEILETFASTQFEGGRHERRVNKIAEIENSREFDCKKSD